MKTLWEIEYNEQVLYEGTWDSDDCVWDWELSREKYPTLDEARRVFNTLHTTDNIPIIRLYECIYDKYGMEEETLLDELD